MGIPFESAIISMPKTLRKPFFFARTVNRGVFTYGQQQRYLAIIRLRKGGINNCHHLLQLISFWILQPRSMNCGPPPTRSGFFSAPIFQMRYFRNRTHLYLVFLRKQNLQQKATAICIDNCNLAIYHNVAPLNFDLEFERCA